MVENWLYLRWIGVQRLFAGFAVRGHTCIYEVKNSFAKYINHSISFKWFFNDEGSISVCVMLAKWCCVVNASKLYKVLLSTQLIHHS